MEKRIVFDNGAGGVAVVIPAPGTALTVEEIAALSVPAGTDWHLVEASEIPSDRTFRGAWGLEKGSLVEVMEKSRAIAHERRRSVRADEFAPFDVQATVPDLAESAEAERVKIRARYDRIQNDMDAGQSVDELRGLVKGLGA